jgi:hypothetical protein
MTDADVDGAHIFKIRSKRAFSTFNILPLNGKIACVFESRPSFVDPPAEYVNQH